MATIVIWSLRCTVQRYLLCGRYACLKAFEPCRRVSYFSDPANTGKRALGVNFDTIGSWNNRLDRPINMEESIRLGRLIPTISLDDIGVASLCGRRQENEDRTITCQMTPTLQLFGIFDGHGGRDAADYVVDKLPVHLKYWLDRGETDLTKIFHHVFIDVNNGFTKEVYHRKIVDEPELFTSTNDSSLESNGKTSRSLTVSSSSGTTATVCLIHNGIHLVIGHVGDSRALLCRKDAAHRLTEDHDPESRAEKERIEQCNGRIIWSSIGRPRVNGVLEMTRSIGDVELKQWGVTAHPDVRSLEIRHGSDAFMVLTTDGVHSVLNSAEIVQIVSSCVDTHEAARLLVDQALLYGSNDNCTTLIVPFGAWGKYSGGPSSRRPLIQKRPHNYFVNRT